MWVTCHKCGGSGYKYHIGHKLDCLLCYPFRFRINDIEWSGQIWINDNYEPISPPSSPR